MNTTPRWSKVPRRSPLQIVIWCMALLGLLVLPINYRAGAESAHGHALLELWADASDGRVQHHAPLWNSGGGDWLDPLVSQAEGPRGHGAAPDTGSPNESMPASGPFLLPEPMAEPGASVASYLVLALGALVVAGRMPVVPSPPPRWSSSTA